MTRKSRRGRERELESATEELWRDLERDEIDLDVVVSWRPDEDVDALADADEDEHVVVADFSDTST